MFILDRDIELKREDGSLIKEADGLLERPLRAETMQGPRVALASSEMVNEGWTLEFTVRVLDNDKTGKSEKLDKEAVLEMLDYGSLKGLLQWRNAGYGSFVFEEVV